MSTPKKFISIALTATTALWASGALLLVPVASAQSPVDLQAQIAALLAQIQQLQAQLNAAKGAPSVSYSYTRDLTVGSKGDDVTALQQMLASGGYLKVSPTGYFGSLTKAAVAAWQAAVGLSPAAGYFGPKSRAYVASLSVAPSTTTPSVPSVPAPASGLAVKLDASNPSAGSLISSTGSAAARVPVLTVDYTAGNSGAVTLNELKFTKTGVISDSSISGAYLVESGKVLAQYNSISSGVISFSGLGLSIAAGQTRALTLAIDPSTGLTAGNTVGFSLAAASNVSSADANGSAVAASGLFPLMGSTFTVTSVSNPSIASMGVVSSSIGTSITAGTTNNIVGAWNFSVSNSKVWLKGVNFKVIGSANKSDVRNLKLYVNGTQVGSTLASVSSDGTAYFDATAAPATLNTGSNNIQVFADIMGSPSYNFQFEILNSYDIYAVDSQYNVPIAGASNTGMQVSITSGSITVSQSGDTPTGNLAPGQSGITIAKFAFYAGGEAVKVKYLDFTLAFNTATSTLSGWVKNVSLTDDAGGQLGTTINTPGGTSSTCAIATAGWTGGTYNDCFGTIASPINYVIPANTTRVLSLKADIQSGASFSSVVGALTAETTNNLQGLTSSASARSGGASGASLTLASSQLIVACNTAVGTQTVAKPATAQKIGSYALTASSADGVTVSTLQFLTQSYGVGSYLQNLKVMVAGTQFGTTQSTVGANGTYSFSGTPFTVPKGGTIYVEVYSDILSSATATTTPAITTMTGLSGTGVTSYNSLSLASNVACQGITVAGQSGITITADSANPAAGQLVMGSTGNSLAAFRFTETSNVENVKITDMNVFDQLASTTAAIKAGFGNMSLYNGSTWLGTAGSANYSAASLGTGGSIVLASSSNATGTYPVTINGTTVNSASIPNGSSSAAIAAALVTAINASAATDVTATQGTGSTSSTITLVALTPHTSGITVTGPSASATVQFTTYTAVEGGNAPGYIYIFHFATPVVIPQANSVSLALKGDVSSYASSGAMDNTSHTFKIATTTDSTNNTAGLAVVSLGASSNATSTVTLTNPNGNAQTILRTKLTVSATPLGVTSGRSKTSIDDLATLNFAADAAGAVVLNSLTVTFSGSATNSSSLFFASGTSSTYYVTLYDSINGTTYNASSSIVGSGTLTYNLRGYTVSAGTSKSFTLRFNSSGGAPAGSASVSQTLSATVAAYTDVGWADSLDASAVSGLNVPASTVPINVQSVSYAIGT